MYLRDSSDSPGQYPSTIMLSQAQLILQSLVVVVGKHKLSILESWNEPLAIPTQVTIASAKLSIQLGSYFQDCSWAPKYL